MTSIVFRAGWMKVHRLQLQLFVPASCLQTFPRKIYDATFFKLELGYLFYHFVSFNVATLDIIVIENFRTRWTRMLLQCKCTYFLLRSQVVHLVGLGAITPELGSTPHLS